MRQSRTQFTSVLTSGQVLTTTVGSLLDHFDLKVDSYTVKTEAIWQVVVAASARGQAIQSAVNHWRTRSTLLYLHNNMELCAPSRWPKPFLEHGVVYDFSHVPMMLSYLQVT